MKLATKLTIITLILGVAMFIFEALTKIPFYFAFFFFVAFVMAIVSACLEEKKLLPVILAVLSIVLIVVGFVVLSAIQPPKPAPAIQKNLTNSTPSQNVTPENPPVVQALTEMKAYFMDVGQADETLFKKGDTEILVDCGSSGNVNYLKSLGVTDIELLIKTHNHADHIGGCDNIINSFKVAEVWDWTTPVRTTKNLSDITLAVLHSGVGSDDQNANSVVTKISYGSIDFMMTGDCESSCESSISMSSFFSPSSEILKVGHHGSSTSTSQSFLNIVNPAVAIISAGLNNQYGHPTQTTLNKLANKQLYRTDLNGNIIVTTNGINYSVSTQKTATQTALTQTATQTAVAVASSVVASSLTEDTATTSGHKFYTSSYSTSKYYYCDTDSQWKTLSTKYLKVFNSEQELLKSYSRILHAPCK